ncbi:MAG TPA: hypothetical protein VN408_34050, partial [Actinoplanes sp.]|nr:hypothetical protein [Actinoplanes sp.]
MALKLADIESIRSGGAPVALNLRHRHQVTRHRSVSIFGVGTAIKWAAVSLYWDPATALTVGQRAEFKGRWDDLLWLNVPGPFWAGETDICWTGRLHAPDHVLYGGEYFTEFVYRQPRTATEVAALADAA